METALKRRIAPSIPLKLELEDDIGSKYVKNFRLSFDANAAAEIEDRTGFNMLRGEIWQKGLSFKSLSIMLWAAVLANHPEYDTENEQGERSDDGLQVIRSYMSIANTAEISAALETAFLASIPKDKRDAIEAERTRREKGQRPLESAGEKPATTDLPGESSGPQPASASESAGKTSAA